MSARSAEVSPLLSSVIFYGTTQVVAETEEQIKAFREITRESTISVEGVVRERASKNPKLPTGDIEIVRRRSKCSAAAGI
jgi:aspartyl-tRNA synthetase